MTERNFKVSKADLEADAARVTRNDEPTSTVSRYCYTCKTVRPKEGPRKDDPMFMCLPCATPKEES